ncbi:amidohydrolase [Haloechinothrix sp. LS1_15]|uniref:amidohydrolase n=1 Tax=Haloechinothrix sp. LS1_15 TaxID=2652248 RepID=UPI0037BFEA04
MTAAGWAADTVFTGARLLAGRDFQVTDAVAVHHGRVIALGEQAKELPARRVVDLDGATVVPGFHDAHNHMAWYGMGLDELDVSAAACGSLEELYDAVAHRAARQPAGSWIHGNGYDQTKLGGGHPTRDGLDRAAPDHYVRLKHTTGHMCVVNSAVLDRIDLAAVPPGGDVVRDEAGRPTGLLRERAQGLLDPLLYPVPLAEVGRGIARASQRYLAEGITSVQEAGIGAGLVGSTPVELAAYQLARERGELGVRVILMASADALHPLQAAGGDGVDFGLDLGMRTGFGDGRLRLGPVKLFADGSLVGRTCAMHEPFAGEPDNTGYFQTAEADIADIVLRAHRSGWQVATHAIGDRAISVVLDAYAAALAAHPVADHRHRIEHCGVIGDGDLRRVAGLGAIPVPQGRFVNEIGDGMRSALGPEREAWCYRQRSFLDAGCVLPGSSDRPVVAGAPLLGMADMVRRRTASGYVLGAGERISPTEALRAYTAGSAYAAFAEADLGTIEPGKRADFAVLSDDPTRQDTMESVAVRATVVGGEMVHEATSGG